MNLQNIMIYDPNLLMKNPGDRKCTHCSALKPIHRHFLFDSVVVHRQSNSGIPTPTLAEALIASKKSASTLLTFNSLRKTVEKVAKNAVYLEGVLGYDESMLKDILRPQLRGLVFALRWIVSFPSIFGLNSQEADNFDLYTGRRRCSDHFRPRLE